MFNLKILIVSLIFISKAYCGKDYDIQIESDSPIAEGTSITFNVTLLIDGKIAPKDKYQFRYIFGGDEKEQKVTEPSVLFVVNTDDLGHGHYSIDFAVDDFFFYVYLEKARRRATFDVTNHFKGLMQLVQNETIRENGYVSSQAETVHSIIISDKDKKLYNKASYVRVYWFINCLYVGMTDALNFTNWYRNENGKYNVEALLMLSFVPLPPPTSTTQAPTTTTTSTTTTSTTTTSTTTPSTTTSTTSTTSTTTTKKPARKKRDASGKEFEWNVKYLVESGSVRPESIAYENMTDPPMRTTTEIPMSERIARLKDTGIPYFGVCTNDTKVVLDPKKIYGYYQRSIVVENPISNITVSNNVWLKHGDMCRLLIKFNGTGPFNYCTTTTHNANSSVSKADDPDCDDWRTTDMKQFYYTRFLDRSSNSYSIAVYIKNEVITTKTTVGVQFYEAQPHSQLSVVIVPIVFTLMAVVLIVFGVAYYVQNRNQFLVEVADFNFGETQSIDSLEHKSFVQRLLDSISDLFIRNQYNEDLDSPGEPSSRNNYSVMP